MVVRNEYSINLLESAIKGKSKASQYQMFVHPLSSSIVRAERQEQECPMGSMDSSATEDSAESNKLPKGQIKGPSTSHDEPQDPGSGFRRERG